MMRGGIDGYRGVARLFFKLIFWMAAAPFWLLWKGGQLAWQLAFKPSIERRNYEHAMQFGGRGTGEEPPHDVRRRKSNCKRSLPPRRPRPRQVARHHPDQRDRRRPKIRTKADLYTSLAKTRFVHAEVGEVTRYSVDMILQLPETDRAIIKQHELSTSSWRMFPSSTKMNSPNWPPTTMPRRMTPPGFPSDEFLHSAVKKIVNEQTLELAKQDRRKTRIGDLLVSPFSRVSTRLMRPSSSPTSSNGAAAHDEEDHRRLSRFQARPRPSSSDARVSDAASGRLAALDGPHGDNATLYRRTAALAEAANFPDAETFAKKTLVEFMDRCDQQNHAVSPVRRRHGHAGGV